MVASLSSDLLSKNPSELIRAVEADAVRDAERVVQFLRDLGVDATPEKPVCLPRQFLQYLLFGLRLLYWEKDGFLFHRQAGLPEARELIRTAFRSLNAPEPDPTELFAAIFGLSLERFAWHGQREFGADVAVDDLVEDVALDALAEFLWASRHSAGTPANSDCEA